MQIRAREIFSCSAILLALAGWGCGPSPGSTGDDDPVQAGQPPAGGKDGQGSARYAKDSVIVRFRTAPSASTLRKSMARVNGTIEDRNGDGVFDRFAHLLGGQLAVVRLADHADVDAAIAALRQDPDVLYAERNYVVQALAAPDDPRFPELYGLNNDGQTGGTPDADIDAVEAWDTSVGSSDVVVGVIDTGVDYTHEDLAANMWVNPGEIPGNGIDDDGNGVIDDVHGFNALNGSGDPYDDYFHGTHCAGTIGAVGNNGVGVAGVNWDTQIMAIKFIDSSGFGTVEGAIASIDYAIAQRNAGVNLRVLSNSWTIFGEFSQALLDAITSAGDAGMLFVAAAANDSSNNDVFPNYPSSYDAPSIVAVAATDQNDALAWFSNYGATSVDLGAPGVDVLSTTPGNTYSSFSGTSMATPHVAGVAALMLSSNDTLTVDERQGRSPHLRRPHPGARRADRERPAPERRVGTRSGRPAGAALQRQRVASEHGRHAGGNGDLRHRRGFARRLRRRRLAEHHRGSADRRDRDHHAGRDRPWNWHSDDRDDGGDYQGPLHHHDHRHERRAGPVAYGVAPGARTRRPSLRHQPVAGQPERHAGRCGQLRRESRILRLHWRRLPRPHIGARLHRFLRSLPEPGDIAWPRGPGRIYRLQHRAGGLHVHADRPGRRGDGQHERDADCGAARARAPGRRLLLLPERALVPVL